MSRHLLKTSPLHTPLVRTFEEYTGSRYAFNLDGIWRYYPSYESPDEYESALARLVLGAATALELDEGQTLYVSMEPFGAEWIEWLLPMFQWTPSDGVLPEWDPSVTRYAELFISGRLDQHYAGICESDMPMEALRFCADLVLRNLAPSSWFFNNPDRDVCVYFHNTSSFGVCTHRPAVDLTVLKDARRLGLEASQIV